MNKSVMIDLETLGTSSNAVVLSFGGVIFNSETGETISEKTVIFCLEDSLSKGLEIDASTLRWWLTQNNEVLKNQLDLEKSVTLKDGIKEIADWLGGEMAFNTEVWANSPSFDLIKFQNVCKVADMENPFGDFRKWRDVRTMIEAAENGRAVSIKTITDAEFGRGNAHDPIHDCKYQIACIVRAANIIDKDCFRD
jgi:hypothetical protein